MSKYRAKATHMPSLERRDDVLHLSGPVTGLTVVELDRKSLTLDGIRAISLDAVTTVDTVGVALIAQLVARASRSGSRPQVTGSPSGLNELCLAYRIAPDFSDFP